MLQPSPKPIPFHRPRRSVCGERSKAANMEFLRSLSVTERIKLALTLQDRFAWLKPKTKN